MCDKAVDSYLLGQKLVSPWFVTNLIEKLDSAVSSDNYIVIGDLGYLPHSLSMI